VIEEKAKPRRRWPVPAPTNKYNLLDKELLAFNAEVPIFSQWDDHEVTKHWWPGEPLTRAEHQRKKYVEKNALILAARASRAFHEYIAAALHPDRAPDASIARFRTDRCSTCFMLDMRSLSRPNGEGQEESYGPAAYFLGPAQVAWLKRELLNSQATWKVIGADMPIGLNRRLRHDRKWGVEAIARATGRRAAASSRSPTSSPSSNGRACAKHASGLTADVHYTAAHYYDPNKAVFQDFEPFWNSCRARSTPEVSRKTRWTTRSDRSSST